MGITLTLADGSTLTVGTIGPETEDIQHLGGPIHGVKWTFDSPVITSVQLGFNSCLCDFDIGSFTTPVILGAVETVDLTPKSAMDPNAFNVDAETCSKGTI